MDRQPHDSVCWPLWRWPSADRAAWALGCTPGDPFDDPRYADGLSAATLGKARKGYGRWLRFLAGRGWLDPDQAPVERVTRPLLRAYFRELRRSGNADATVIGRFHELTMALRILEPGCAVSWIRRPDGVSIYTLLPKRKRPMVVPDSGVLFDWGLAMMDEARQGRATSSLTQLVAFRDGLLIAILAARGRRLRSMRLLRVGRELAWHGGRYRVELTPEQVKTGKPDRFDLPERLTPYVRHYLAVVRPALLQGQGGTEEALWISAQGTPLSEVGIQTRLFRLTRRRFGAGFGPHRFRHAIGTTAALRDPGHPGLAAGLLGISAEVLEQHYNRAGQSLAASRYDELIEKRRRELQQRKVPL